VAGGYTSFDGHLIHTFDYQTLRTYDGRATPPLLIREKSLSPRLECELFEVIGDNIYFDALKVYDLNTLKVKAQLDLDSEFVVNKVMSFGDKIYVLLRSYPYETRTSSIKIYDSTTFKYLGDLLSYQPEFSCEGIDQDKMITVTRPNASINGSVVCFIDLKDGTKSYHIISSIYDVLSYTIG
jgi:hypothetical protein